MPHDYGVCALKPGSCSYWSPIKAVLCNKRSHGSEKPAHNRRVDNWEEPTRRPRPRAAKNKEINNLLLINSEEESLIQEKNIILLAINNYQKEEERFESVINDLLVTFSHENLNINKENINVVVSELIRKYQNLNDNYQNEELDILKQKVKEGVDVAFGGITPLALIIGFLAAFISGCIACKWMIAVVKRGKLIYFAYYCLAAGVFTLVYSFLI